MKIKNAKTEGSRFNFLLYSIFIITLCGFLAYKLFLEKNIFHFIDTSDKLDFEYYSMIFQYLVYPFTAIILLLGVFLLFRQTLYSTFTRLLNYDKLIIWLIGFIFIFQFLVIFLIPNKPFSDSVYYLELANRLVDTGSYTTSNGNLTAFWPVGYPLYLTGINHLFGNGLLAIKLFNIFFSMGLVLSMYWLLKPVLNKSQLNLFVFLFCLYPGFILNSNVIMPEYISAFVLWICIYLFTKKPYNKINLILAGALLGFGTLIRPTFLLLPMLFLIIIYFQKERIRKSYHSLIFALSFLVIISPWLIRNCNLYNTFPVIATNGGFNFLMGNHSNSSGKINFDFEYNANNPNEVAEESKAYSSGFESILNEPLNALFRPVKKIFFSYYRGDSSVTWVFKGENYRYNPILLSSVFFISNYFHWIIIILSLFGFKNLLVLFKEKKMMYLLGFLLYFLVIIVIFVGNERYIIPILPIHFISAVLFIKNEKHNKK